MDDAVGIQGFGGASYLGPTVGGRMALCLQVEVATRVGGGELRSVSSSGALWDPRIFLMLNEIEGTNGSTAVYVPGVGWNSIAGCYRKLKPQRFRKVAVDVEWNLWECNILDITSTTGLFYTAD